MSVYYIYVVAFREQEQLKYYIGRTTNPERRRAEHRNGLTAFTRGKKIVHFEVVKEETLTIDEFVVTLSFMKSFGIDNVRGGPFCNMQINDSQKKYIQFLHAHLTCEPGCIYETREDFFFSRNLELDLPGCVKVITYTNAFEKFDGYFFYLYHRYLIGYPLDDNIKFVLRSVYNLCYRCGGEFNKCGCR